MKIAAETARNGPKQGRGVQNVRYVAINTFLIFHILAIACWCIPIGSPIIPLCKDLVRPYLLWSGLFQSWDMFSPNPKSVNNYVEALIIYKNGSTQLWSFPRMDHLGLSERYFKERYRKFVEVLQQRENSDLRPDVARYILRLNGQRSSPAQVVILVERWSEIIPPTDDAYDRGPSKMNVLYSYTVRPEDLQ